MRSQQSSSVVRWACQRLGTVTLMVLHLTVLGVWQAMWQRRFAWRSFAWVSLGVLLGLYGVGWALDGGVSVPVEQLQWWLWTAVFGLFGVGGWMLARCSRRWVYWECYLMILVIVGLMLAQLAGGWAGFAELMGMADPQRAELFGPLPLGIRWFGSLWVLVVSLGGLGAFLVALIGASIGVMQSSAMLETGHWGVVWSVTRRHLRAADRGVSRTARVAVLGIAVGVVALVVVTSVMSGYQHEIEEKILATNPHLVLQKYGLDLTEYRSLQKRTDAVPGVVASTPFIFSQAMLSTASRGVGVMLKGVDPRTAVNVSGLGSSVCPHYAPGLGCKPQHQSLDGNALSRLFDAKDGYPALLVGDALLRRLGVPLGTVVRLTTPIGIAGARGDAPKQMRFRLAGVFHSGMHEFDSRLAYVTIPSAQRFLGLGKAVHGLEYKVKDPAHVTAIKAKLYQTVGGYPYRIKDWRQINASLFAALKYQKVIFFLVMVMIVIVAAFNVASTLFMTVVERAADIAILKSMGMSDTTVMKIFVCQGWIVGLVGTVLGVISGLILCGVLSRLHLSIAADVYEVGVLKVFVQPREIVLVVLASLGIGHLATLYPALRASMLRPIEAFRYD